MKKLLVLAPIVIAFTVLAPHRALSKRLLVKVDGSSTVYPITEAVAEEFQAFIRGRVMITVGISGTGGGFKKFCRGEIDISDASRPIKPSELELCGKNGIDFIELPVAFDGIAVVVNPANNWVNHMTVEELRKIWEPSAQGRITTWNQVRSSWPKKEIHLFGPGVDSGTYDYFTKAIVGKGGASRGDFTASEDDNVLVQGVSMDPLALGFFGLAYYEENQEILKAVPIDDGNEANGRGAIPPSAETVKNGTYQPLSRPIFIYVRKEAADREEVSRFVEFYLKNAGSLAREVGYVPLPEKAYELALERFRSRKTGTIFGGKGATIGISIEKLLTMEK